MIPDTALKVTSSIPLLKSSLISLPSLGGYDIGDTANVSIHFSSLAPSNRLKLRKLSYIIDGIETNLLTTRYNNSALRFEPLVEVVTPIPTPLLIGKRLNITSSVLNVLDPTSISDVKVIHGFSLGAANIPHHFGGYV